MARNKSPLQINLEYYPIKGLFNFLRWLPLAWSERLSAALLAILMIFLPKRRRIMTQNLADCFPDLSARERRAIERESLQTLARSIAYAARIPEWARIGTETFVRVEGERYAENAFKQGKGVLMLASHFGFWEILPIFLQKRFGRTWGVARPLDNPLLDKLINSLRGANGAGIIPQHQILKQGLKRLRQNELVGILMDQNLYKGGIFVDLFGRPAATTTIISLLARRTGSAVIPLHTVWEGPTLRVIFEPPLPLSAHPDPATAVAEDTQAMVRILEGWIRKAPGQWLWIHNRWKRRPEAGDVVYSG